MGQACCTDIKQMETEAIKIEYESSIKLQILPSGVEFSNTERNIDSPKDSSPDIVYPGKLLLKKTPRRRTETR